ncbi:MAG: hypothetical protein AWU54_298 [Candidatus Frackibacter sp. T328-2]|nr:MAG: hypothetical protein AWU54_298 [Candidatus Frackibacter sp. T328-2]
MANQEYTVLCRFVKPDGTRTEPLPVDEFCEVWEEKLKNWDRWDRFIASLLRIEGFEISSEENQQVGALTGTGL